jgi:hypothetical protein
VPVGGQHLLDSSGIMARNMQVTYTSTGPNVERIGRPITRVAANRTAPRQQRAIRTGTQATPPMRLSRQPMRFYLLFLALPMLSVTRNLTIRWTSLIGKGSPRRNWTEPLDLLYFDSSRSNSLMPLGVG